MSGPHAMPAFVDGFRAYPWRGFVRIEVRHHTRAGKPLLRGVDIAPDLCGLPDALAYLNRLIPNFPQHPVTVARVMESLA